MAGCCPLLGQESHSIDSFTENSHACRILHHLDFTDFLTILKCEEGTWWAFLSQIFNSAPTPPVNASILLIIYLSSREVFLNFKCNKETAFVWRNKRRAISAKFLTCHFQGKDKLDSCFELLKLHGRHKIIRSPLNCSSDTLQTELIGVCIKSMLVSKTQI